MTVRSTLLNGSATINGRGIGHRKLDQDQAAELAADAVTGARPVVPSYEQACRLFNVPTLVLREHLKARREVAVQPPPEAGNGNGKRVAYRRKLSDADCDAIVASFGAQIMAALDRATRPRCERTGETFSITR